MKMIRKKEKKRDKKIIFFILKSSGYFFPLILPGMFLHLIMVKNILSAITFFLASNSKGMRVLYMVSNIKKSTFGVICSIKHVLVHAKNINTVTCITNNLYARSYKIKT